MKYDFTLYLVTDRDLISTQTLPEAVEQAILGGCTMVQLLEKSCGSLDFYQQAVEAKVVTDRYHIPLIINDRIAIALAVKAAGVHLGQNDLPAARAREFMPQEMLRGVSVTTVQETRQAQADGADYIGVGAMFPTGTKADASLVPMDELKRIHQNMELSIVIIGGITRENAPHFRSYGIEGLAVASAILAQPDIKRAAAELKTIFCGGGADEFPRGSI